MKLLTTLVSALALAFAQVPAVADSPGQGRTARFEIEFMKLTIDHHYSALRMTELAAGTDMQRSPDIAASEGTAPTPGFGATPAKATLDDLKSLARRNNRMQREEIMTMQRFLRDWYGVDHQPRLREDGRAAIAVLERTPAGAAFNRSFYESFSRHHYMLLEPVNGCVTGTDLAHEDLRRECNMAWHNQTADIQMMRTELKKHFGIVDFQPFRGLDPLQPRDDGPRGGGQDNR
ncbi:DUF305 domain-containing protein [Aquabacterium sp. J223]|uniref:DUF305 domain-containing protein n=1 Tax=Aquabacterium sp. J223 TaxID=2898431 RepID=UPI0021AD9F8D|nr:DUF305 domain-containing protein [Aquabacterium sp. J223]UUX96679.1 DUF305 domain-containing protein [Aquabacterium sp. J223]